MEDERRPEPPVIWTRILRQILPGEEGERIVESLAELYAFRYAEHPRSADAWYRRQVFAFLLRLRGLTGRGSSFPSRRGARWDAFRQDTGFAVRQFTRRPGFALLAVLTTGLGVGAATAIFGVVRAVVLEPLPYPAAERLVRVIERTPAGGEFVTSEPNFIDFRDRSQSFEAIGAYQSSPVGARLGGEPVQLSALRTTAGFFAVLGGQPLIGRTYDESEAGVEPATVAVLSHALWRDEYGSDGGVVGQSIALDGVPHVVIGVMPSGWEPIVETDLWLPQRLNPYSDRGDHMLSAIALLSEESTIDTAIDDLTAIQHDLSDRFPESNGGWSIDVLPLKSSLIGEQHIRAGWVLLGAVALLLLLACISVSNLLIARATVRRREVGLRTALGASPARVLRQLLTESTVLSLAGGVLGVFIAWFALPVLQSLSPPGTPRIEDATIDLVVLAFALAVTLGSGLLFGLTPALHALGGDLRNAMSDGERGSSRSGERIRSTLVVAQVAVAFTLLVGVGLLAATFLRLRAEDPGMNVDQTLAIPLTLPGEQYDDAARRNVLREIENRLEGVPGIQTAGIINVPPYGELNTANQLTIEGRFYPDNTAPMAFWRAVSSRYFEAAGVSIVAGRALQFDDRGPGGGDRGAAVVNETMATRIWGSPEAALGRRLAMSRNSTNWMRVVGVAADVRDIELAEQREGAFYFPDGGWWPWMTIIVRTERAGPDLAPLIRSAIWEVAPDLPVPTIEPVATSLGRLVAGPRFNFILMLSFGSIALLLAILGVFGVTHLAVSRRAREIGIRMVLGANLRGMVGMVVRRSAGLALAGVVLGLVMAVALGRAMEAILFRTHPLDSAILGGAAAIMLASSLIAAWLPARRAAQVDPASVLRAE